MKVVYSIIGVVTTLWVISIALLTNTTWDVWFLRKQLILLTGLIAFTLMAFIMVLSIRPKWLEKHMAGLDKMYLIHKWAGIWAIITGALHYLMELAGPLLAEFFVRGAKGPKVENFLSPFRGISKDLGEWVMWFLLVALVITLWHKFSYTIWRYTHKLMPVVFVILAFHAVVLSPVEYWTQPIGWLVAVCSFIGVWCAVVALFGLIGKSRTYKATVQEVDQLNSGVINVTCQLQGNWQHKAGQYAFLQSSKLEGAHPFTISSADSKNNTVRFSIKALGDYTNYLQTHLKAGDLVTIEGPYGCFDFREALSKNKRQIWIAGGIGVTPFIAWLESLKTQPLKEDEFVELYYCVRNEQEGSFAQYLTQLASEVAQVSLHIHYSDQSGYLNADALNLHKDTQGVYPNIWFCGPMNFSASLKKGLEEKEVPLKQFHQEAFQMR
ncbi:ferredoxin reductase family protein [Neisseria sp. Ec49-e6-T10]|uniref:ferredoxin reductase family protein n=1 Tax=Neisseria sp. Ec49-e6-T10 TaxID=3140744 RepID=UPI003EBA7176